MPATQSSPQGNSTACESWDDEIVRQLHRHMRIHFRYLSPAVRQMTLRQCMEETDPSAGMAELIKKVEVKLSL